MSSFEALLGEFVRDNVPTLPRPEGEVVEAGVDHSKGFGGCDTCDYGGECSFEVWARFAGEDKRRYVEVEDFGGLIRDLTRRAS